MSRPVPKIITTTIHSPNGEYPLSLPASDAWLVRQIFDRHEYGLNRDWLRTPPVILDVGANVGTFALYAKLAYHPDAIIHCFEPCPSTLDLLRANITPFTGITIHPLALGQTDGEIDLYLDREHPVCHSVKPHLIPKPAGQIRVPIRDAGVVWDELKLDELDVLKLDAEGCEVEVLEALGTRLSQVRVVLVEFHTPEDRWRIDTLLASHALFSAQAYSHFVGVMKFVRPDLVRPNKTA